MHVRHSIVGLIALVAMILTPFGPATRLESVAEAQTSDPPGRVGRLNYMNGQVSFAPGGVDEWAAAILNYPLTTGAALWTDDAARAEFHVGGHAIRMDQATEVDILGLDDQTTQLRVPQGTIDIGLRQLAAGEQFEINTPSAAVTLTRAGHYRFDVDPTGESTRVTVWSGQADVTTSRTVLTVRSGEAVVVSDNGVSRYEMVSAAGLDAFGQWCMAREQKETQALQAASPYLPMTMTGLEDLAYYGTWQVIGGYGRVWYPRMRSDWTPYRHGRWMYVPPWGWTWVDNAPWGFTPFHHGRWAFIRDRWGWVPGGINVRPIYAPALVVFVILGGGRIGWFPLAPRDVYVPPYRYSSTYYRNINPMITNITIININRVNYVHRHSSNAISIIRQEDFRRSRRVDTSLMTVSRPAVSNAAVAASAPVEATLPSLLGRPAPGGTAHKPPAAVRERPVVVRTTPPSPVAPPALGPRVPGRVAPVKPVIEQPRPTQPRPTERQIVGPTPQPRSTERPTGVPTPRVDRPVPTQAPEPGPTERQFAPPTPRPTQGAVPTPPPQMGVPTPRPRPTPRTDGPEPTQAPQPRPTERQFAPPTPRPTQGAVPTPPPPQMGVPTPRPRPTPQLEQPQPTPTERQRGGPTSGPRVGDGRGNARATPNCDPRSKDYDPARCPKPTPTQTKRR